MSDAQPIPPEEEPRERFRRLLSEVDGAEGEDLANLVDPFDDESWETDERVQPAQGLPDASADTVPQSSSDLDDTAPSSSSDLEDQPDASADTAPRSSSDLDDIEPKSSSGLEDTAPLTVNNKPAQVQPVQTQGDTVPMRLEKPASPPPGFGDKTIARKPSYSEYQNNHLPRVVDQVDNGATRVSAAAYSAGRPAYRFARAVQPAPSPSYPISDAQPGRRTNVFRKGLGCLVRGFLISLFVLVAVALCSVSLLFYQYYRIASTLPDIGDLRQHASHFETTRILDRNGNVLYEILDPNAGRRTYVRLDQMSPYLVAATVSTEDQGFYSHPGFDPAAILRAFLQNYQGGGTVSGASTITQQLSRNLLFSPAERVEISYQRKIREAILATEITRRYSKDEILELYMNENFYGNLAYGVEAASETYFGTTADMLTLGQAAFIAGLPQAPAVYDIYSNPEATIHRLEDVLVLMYQTSQEEGCIYVSNQPQRVCLDPVSVTAAAEEIKNYDFNTPEIGLRYPHWVTYVRGLLEAQYDPQTIYRSGFSVYTTLDPAVQDLAQKAVEEQVESLAAQKATNGALVAIRPSTGEILAMIGSADFYSEAISGQVNMAISPRQPGSTIKPLTYLAAFEKGWTPATLLWDVPSEFTPSGQPYDPMPAYKPVNFDDRFHGPVTLRSALANSYNIPAVKTLQFIGIYDNPETPEEDGLIPIARRLGITTLNRPDYGLSLTLGGGGRDVA